MQQIKNRIFNRFKRHEIDKISNFLCENFSLLLLRQLHDDTNNYQNIEEEILKKINTTCKKTVKYNWYEYDMLYDQFQLQIAIEWAFYQIISEHIELPLTQDNSEQLFTHIEKAYWYYVDSFYDMDETLPPLSLHRFIELLFKFIEQLQEINSEEFIRNYYIFANNRKVCGTIILNKKMDLCVVVCGYTRNWTFPKGKIEPNETEKMCAIRETYEEIGLDVSDNITDDYVVDQIKHYFFVTNVDETVILHPESSSYTEIFEIRWVPIDYLKKYYQTSKVYDSILQYIDKHKS